MEVFFTYKTKKFKPFRCEPQEKIKDICESFCSNNNIVFSNVYFEIEGLSLEKAHYNKPISWFVCDDKVDIFIYDNYNTERSELNFEEECEVIFWFKSNSTIIKCNYKSQMIDVCESFAKKINKNLFSLDFFYRTKKVEKYKKFCEIAGENDKKKRKIKIIVEERKDRKRNKKNKNNNVLLSGCSSDGVSSSKDFNCTCCKKIDCSRCRNCDCHCNCFKNIDCSRCRSVDCNCFKNISCDICRSCDCDCCKNIDCSRCRSCDCYRCNSFDCDCCSNCNCSIVVIVQLALDLIIC